MSLIDSLVEAEKTHTALAKKLGVVPGAISNWKKKGIPPSQWPNVAALARKHGLPHDLDTLAAKPRNGHARPKPRKAG